MKSFIFFLFMIVLLSSCGKERPISVTTTPTCLFSGIPVEGTECGRQSLFLKDPFPFVGSLMITGRDPQSFCTATLISPQMAITAKHCLQAALGKYSLSSIIFALTESVQFPVTDFFLPGDLPFNEIDFLHSPDVAVLNLDSSQMAPTFFKQMVFPKLLHVQDARLKDLESLEVKQPLFFAVGMGLTQPKDNARRSLGKKYYYHPQWHSYLNQEMTFYQKGQQTCPGDSGGPLFIKDQDDWLLIGVIARGSKGCGHDGLLQSYYSTFQFLPPWVEDILKNNPSDSLPDLE